MHRPAVMASAAATAAAVLLAPPAAAAVIGYDIAWSGAIGDTMAGNFSFDDANAADGRIDGSELLTLNIEGFLNGVSIGSWDLADGLGAGAFGFNFNFDLVAEAFFIGGIIVGPSGQAWNALAKSGLGFASGASGEGLTLDGGLVGPLVPPSELRLVVARQETAVPAPPALALLGGGLALLAWCGRRSRSC